MRVDGQPAPSWAAQPASGPVVDRHAEDTAAVKPVERLVTVLVTLSVPDTADADDAATLIAVAADSTALTVIHTTGVEGHLPLPGSTVLRGRQERPWLVQSVVPHAAILTDLAGGTIQVELTHLHPDQVDSPTETSAVATEYPTADHGTDLA